jgi:heterodisulfide reductase subunit B
MKASFFPGCSLEGTAREYGESIDAVSGFLGIKLEELPGWTCCGASAAHCINEFLSVSLPAKNLLLAEKLKHDLVTPCAACFSRLKTAEKALTQKSKEIDASTPFRGEIKVLHLLEFFSREDLTKMIKEQIKRPLSNLKVVSYYGCIVRPPRLHMPRIGRSSALDNLISLIQEELFWPYKTECCGEVAHNYRYCWALVGFSIWRERGRLHCYCLLCGLIWILVGRNQEGKGLPIPIFIP